MRSATEHFNSEKEHTKIKHALFKSALDTSLSIANGINYSKKENNSYVYVDLFAGAGKFDDNNNGSPIIALNAFEKYKFSAQRTFSNIEMVVAEKDSQNIQKLASNIKIEKQNLNLEKFKCEFCSGSWENHADKLKQYIKSNQWGFIFVDPFSLELNFKNLLNFINESPYYKDILILINKSAQERVLGKIESPDIEKLCSYFDIEKSILKRLFSSIKQKGGTNEDVIQLLIKRSLSKLDKDYIINAAITRTRDGKLENSDRFYLCLITSSIGVANSFLEKYADLIEEKNLERNNRQLNLLNTSPITKYKSLEESIVRILDKKDLTLFELSQILYNVFLSWKYTEENEIPHRQALLTALNNLLLNKSIKLIKPEQASDKCISTSSGKLLAKSLNSKECAKTIPIGLYR